ncbi:MAG TPA: NAD(P)-dependent oxidoreductase [Stellaceae bacterium]|nr:NAD(P)-dependent oxidoreductase [Stellaceae bacterium]
MTSLLVEMHVLPLFVDISRLKLALVGNGETARRRLGLLEEAGAVQLDVFAEAPSPLLATEAGARLERRWPSHEELARAQIVFVADAPASVRAAVSRAARVLGVLVHVEDEPTLSDAQMPAVLRRGGLTLAVSTGGASPALATRVRDFLGALFGQEWRGRLEEVSRLRRVWREAGMAPSEVAELTDAWVSRRGWLSGFASRH